MSLTKFLKFVFGSDPPATPRGSAAGQPRRSDRPAPDRPAAKEATRVADTNRSGVVVAVHPAKAYGFIAVDSEPGRPAYSRHLFVHLSDTQLGTLRADDRVRFDVLLGHEKGPRAVNVMPRAAAPSLLEELGAMLGAPLEYALSGATAAPPPPPAAPAAAAADPGPTGRVGKVVKFDPAKRFGIVRCFDTNKTFLAHFRQFKPPLRELRVGQVVQFDLTTGPRGRPAADHVEVIVDAAEPPPSGQQQTATKGRPGPGAQQQETATKGRPGPSADHYPSAILTPQDDMTTAVSEEFGCSICFELLAVDSVQTPCDHYFCRKCIVRWLQVQSVCPTCKDRVVRSQLAPVPRGIRNLLERTRTSMRR